jgi:hypothetical protein
LVVPAFDYRFKSSNLPLFVVVAGDMLTAICFYVWQAVYKENSFAFGLNIPGEGTEQNPIQLPEITVGGGSSTPGLEVGTYNGQEHTFATPGGPQSALGYQGPNSSALPYTSNAPSLSANMTPDQINADNNSILGAMYNADRCGAILFYKEQRQSTPGAAGKIYVRPAIHRQ